MSYGRPTPLPPCTATVTLDDGRTLVCHWWAHGPGNHVQGGPGGLYWRVEGGTARLHDGLTYEQSTARLA